MSTSPAVLSLTDPGGVPEAAMARLLVTAAGLADASKSALAGGYAPWLAKAAVLAGRASRLLEAALDGSATESETAGLLNVTRVAHAGANLFSELARRTTRRTQIGAMQWASLHRKLYADTALTQREHAVNATLGIDVSLSSSPVRILPGAEPAVAELDRDWLVFGSAWNLEELADTMTQWVSVT